LKIRENPPKLFQSGKDNYTQVSQCDSATWLHLFQNKECANNYNDHHFFYPGQDKKCIQSFIIGSHLHQNLQTNSMFSKKNRLFITNFPLVSISQYNANSPATLYWHNATSSTIYRFRYLKMFLVVQNF